MAAMSIAPVTLPTPVAPPAVSAGSRGADGFGETLTRAVAEVNGLQREASEAVTTLAAGGGVDSAQALVAVEKANVSFQFAIQIRNKLLEAYQEIMRMSV